MAYALRAKNDLKRPQRYSESNNSQNESDPAIVDPKNAATKPGLDLATTARKDSLHEGKAAAPLKLPSPPPVSPISPISTLAELQTATPLAPAPARSAATSRARPRTQVTKMPPYDRQSRRNKRAREDSEQDDDSEIAAPPRRPATRPHRKKVESPPPEHTAFTYPTLTPAAFPTQTGTLPPSKDAQTEWAEAQQHARHLIEARQKCDQKRIEEYQRVVDRLYACSNPKDKDTRLDSVQSIWYQHLKGLWVTEGEDKDIKFTSLYYSIRHEIIDRIREEFPEGSFHDPNHPVRTILGLSPSEFNQSRDSDDDVWDFGEEFPRHILEYKRLHPDEAVDPDMPSPKEIVRAIAFLKQNHLAGNLLGQWQTPLPSAECFTSVAQEARIAAAKYEQATRPHHVSHRRTDKPATPGPSRSAGDLRGGGQASSQTKDRNAGAANRRYASQARKNPTATTTPPTSSSPTGLQSVSYTANQFAALRVMNFPADSARPRTGTPQDYPFPTGQGPQAQRLGVPGWQSNATETAGLKLSLSDRTTLHPTGGRTPPSNLEDAWMLDVDRINVANFSGPAYIQNTTLNRVAQPAIYEERRARRKAKQSPNASTSIPYPPVPRFQSMDRFFIQQPASGEFKPNPTLLPYEEVHNIFAQDDDYIPPGIQPSLRGQTASATQEARASERNGPAPPPPTTRPVEPWITDLYRPLCQPLSEREPEEQKPKNPKSVKKTAVAGSAPQATTAQSAIAQTPRTQSQGPRSNASAQKVTLANPQSASAFLRQHTAQTQTPHAPPRGTFTDIPQPQRSPRSILPPSQPHLSVPTAVPVANMYPVANNLAQVPVSSPASPTFSETTSVDGTLDVKSRTVSPDGEGEKALASLRDSGVFMSEENKGAE